MSNSTATDQSYQQETHEQFYSPVYLDIPYKIKKETGLEPYEKAIAARLFAFAKSKKNNVFAGYGYLAKNYDIAEPTMRKIISKLRSLKLMRKDSFRFIDMLSFEHVPDDLLKIGVAPITHIPDFIFGDSEISWADKIFLGDLYYWRNKIDGSVCVSKKYMCEATGLTIDQVKGKIKKYVTYGILERRSTGNKQILMFNHLKPEIEARLNFQNTHQEKLSTGGVSTPTKGGEDRIKGGEDRITGGVNTGSHINNNINNKNKYYDATPLNEKEPEPKHDYVPNWKKDRKPEAKNTVPEYGSEDFHKRNNNEEAEALSKQRAEALKSAFVEANRENLGDDIDLFEKPVTNPESVLDFMFKKLSAKRTLPDENQEQRQEHESCQPKTHDPELVQEA